MSCGVGCRCGSDPTLLWLWCRLVAAAPIRPPNLGTSICCGCGPKKAKKKKKKKKKKKSPERETQPFPSVVIILFSFSAASFCYLGCFLSSAQMIGPITPPFIQSFTLSNSASYPGVGTFQAGKRKGGLLSVVSLTCEEMLNLSLNKKIHILTSLRNHFSSIRLGKPEVRWHMKLRESRNSSALLLLEMQKGTIPMQGILVDSSKIRGPLFSHAATLLLELYPKDTLATIWKDVYMHQAI